ncbi:hypothetical protein P154DRAFT_519052 [Amniculicola lignicola CBS 123094]|uniref:KOW domain-containing protein n=1 Tax=Amniculicola lignicola CBS 123094 TaxID=1392246 RepID=A0A6A5WTV2_9PLEO|nr:hypothetical protein P154DRAFT_519052 [Amniculicola lignicola CBS 123094]
MSALKRTAPTEKQLRKSLAIKKVLTSIRYAERQKRLKAPLLNEQYEHRSYLKQSQRHHDSQALKFVKLARRNAREDWKLGPLRPNRAVGADRERWGVVKQEHFVTPTIPEHSLLERDKWPAARRTWVTRIENWPIWVDDRVVVIRGREKNKIGKILDIDKERNTVLIKGVNVVYFDGRDALTAGDAPEAKIERETPVPFSDIRLVYKLMRPHPAYPHNLVPRDVVVDAIELRRHTSGIDPWTGEDVASIPIEHQKDPETGEWIYHRYVRGTGEYLKWPWVLEQEKRDALDEEAKKRRTALHDNTGVWDKVKKVLPFGRKNDMSVEQQEEEEPDNRLRAPPPKPRPDTYSFGCDTTADIIMDTSWTPNVLRSPPIPEFVVSELNAWKYEAAIAKEERKAMTDEEKQAQRAERWAEKQEAMAEVKRKMDERLALMKTPQQVAWELEQAKKIETRKTEHDVPPELLHQIGELMIQRGKVPKGRL